MERLTATAWTAVARVTADDHPGPNPLSPGHEDVGGGPAFAVDLPGLDPGVYRLTRTVGGSVRWALFWAGDTVALPGLHVCAVKDPSASEYGTASWAVVLRWNGTSYAATDETATPDRTGVLLGTVTCNVATSGLGAGHPLADGDATFEAGTPIFALQGVPVPQAVLVGGRVFRAG